jgi:4-diphosphocytidyl-2-C-methyl-D-erythritol kinase
MARRSNPAATITSRAKVNLGLSVGPKRADGFHDIVTVMALLELHDTIRITPARGGIKLTSNDRSLPAGPANLAHQAAASLLAAARSGAGCRIHITKRIPVGAGLGGGSSNAAAVLYGLNRLLDSPVAPARLRRLSAGIGSDVPVFLAGHLDRSASAFVARGRGERLRRIGLPRLHLVLHFPGYGIPTHWAYEALDRLRSRRRLTSFRFSPKILGTLLARNELDKVAAQVGNDFEAVVIPEHPDLRRVKELLLAHGACAAAMSGSGSTVYGLVRSNGWQDPMAALKRSGFSAIHTTTI